VVASCGAPRGTPAPASAPANRVAPAALAASREAPPALVDGAPDDAALAVTMAALARATLAKVPDDGTERSLLDRALLEGLAGDPRAELASLERMRKASSPADPSRAPVLQVGYELHARAELARTAAGRSFADSFAAAFREVYGRLDDLAANHASWFLWVDLDRAKADLQQSLDRLRGRAVLALDQGDALDLAQRYARYVVYRDLLPLVKPLQAEDDARRYTIDDDVRIPTHDGATLSAVVVRPRRLEGRQPAVLFFTIYAGHDEEQAFLSAAHGYIGVTVFSRGKRHSAGPIVPYEHEVDDTHDAIDWISRQPWSDGRVAMYGGSYAGFTQWAATKYMHPALKTIVPYVAAIPGQGLPMENNVFLEANYAWAFYVTDGPSDDEAVYSDRQRWDSLGDRWFASGRAYREIDRVDGTPNPLLQRWLAHPSYDSYWQAMVPYGRDFARIDIPVLTVTGYYDDGQISALRYFTEHTQRRKGAEHYLLIGPWDHFGAQRRPTPVLRGYAIDPVARIDTTYVTFQWLDHVLRGGPMPTLLADKVNYEVMGANEWRHASSIEKMHDDVLTLYLDAHRLSPTRPAHPGVIAQEVDLADRKMQYNDSYYPFPIVHDALDDGHGVVFTSEPLEAPLTIDGAFSGELRARINKKDMDIGIVLYERTPEGRYFSLSYYLGRASYARDMTVRRLLKPGAIETIPFERTRMVSRKLSKGSQIVVVVNVNKNSSAEVNYGTGKDVADESVADAGEPLRIEWYGDGFVKIPVHR
jgi:putative CocE/NonD family hydrolase